MHVRPRFNQTQTQSQHNSATHAIGTTTTPTSAATTHTTSSEACSRLGLAWLGGGMRSSNAKTILRDQERPPSRLGIVSDCGGRAGERRDAAAHVRYGDRGLWPSSAALRGSNKATDSSFRGRRRCGGETLGGRPRGGHVQLGVLDGTDRPGTFRPRPSLARRKCPLESDNV